MRCLAPSWNGLPAYFSAIAAMCCSSVKFSGEKTAKFQSWSFARLTNKQSSQFDFPEDGMPVTAVNSPGRTV
jgi:hypothetical protein